MHWRNDGLRYGLVSLVLHWVMALAIIAMFASGLWMRTLDYYDSWYHTAPELHKSAGILLLIALVLRLLWRLVSPPPPVEGSPLVRRAAGAGHLLLYGLMLTVMVAGYLISTADGVAIDVFGWFRVPATLSGLQDQADIAGKVHLWCAWTLIVLAGLHVLAALKHHFVDRDGTLVRMLGRVHTPH
ncbi:cytochrome b [Pseudomonas rhizoryzae]|uniref:cytochrome b n=1 Tax=Pseudomonas rhizoryzae TaxID=2571129 RepID=UPI0007372839|nr:cytochrome b [Pseudomonas rhizoryzae]APQ13271.1 cytochrome b [Pseudomonas psychrotolerans]KTT04248.1 cytochrome B561 [Pseudomonas psychrotolerans]KTT11084.1 cytochrome B561 [Pseudomonas psychrotolerans]KTT50259.1 cytochrome B561 [Pseudomonas psychrotolerans]KTT65045.1 cytochrome B561 [Pseudomonas psychrotolerans]